MNEKYSHDDMIRMPHPDSKRHPRMANIARAAQFAPFAALTGHDAAIYETVRQVDARPVLSDDRLQELNQKIEQLKKSIHDSPEIKIRYFVPDGKKDGGAFHEKTGTLKKIDIYAQTLIFSDHTVVPMADLTEIFL